MFFKNRDKILLLYKFWGMELFDGVIGCIGYGFVGILFDDIGFFLFKILLNILFFFG